MPRSRRRYSFAHASIDSSKELTPLLLEQALLGESENTRAVAHGGPSVSVNRDLQFDTYLGAGHKDA